MAYIENTFSIVTVEQYLDRYIETDVSLSANCIATAVLGRFEVSAQQWVYTPLYIYIRIYLHSYIRGNRVKLRSYIWDIYVNDYLLTKIVHRK